MALQETVYLNRDNAIKLGLVADGVPVNASTITKVAVKLVSTDGAITSYNSDDDPNAFDFTSETGEVVDKVTTILVIRLQDATTPPSVNSSYQATVIIFDSNNTDGLVWGDPFQLRVINE